ncbi:trypsin-like peptidase domain-containing protein [Bradyrhizobium canariense]|uniref:trypsin-like peptidase domain-containing protein n=1 Tax=Bradyrhizobium canariense TaxID=255045 RepID=UPI0013747D65|nr:trypsin-like peptidase domain-containing protein [Bradyrhizobium canariense]
MLNLELLTAAVVAVGDGRGFVVETQERLVRRLVVTAAHCLPKFPPSAAISFTEERTYPELIGALGEGPTIWAECLFVDPIGDIALLGPVDNQALAEEAFAYDELVEGVEPIRASKAREDEKAAYLLSLDCGWQPCEVLSSGGPLWLRGAWFGIRGGMSGSPIIGADGKALGVVTASGGAPGAVHTEGGPQPCLAANLPKWCDLV